MGEGDLKGLCDGVARADFAAKPGMFSRGLAVPKPGGNLDGTVPARARRV